MVITFVGSGDAFGSGGRLQTCIHVATQDDRILIDCGASSLIGMKRLGIDPKGIGLILLSHLHGDHFGGIPFLLLDAQFTGRAAPLTIAGPPGTQTRVEQAQEVLFPGSSRVQRKFPVHFAEWAPGKPWQWGAIRVTPFEVSHPSGAPPFALRVEAAGRTVAYTGDTEWVDALIPAAQGADLLIAESLFFDKMVKYHLSLAILRGHLSALDAKRIILTHMGPEMLAHAGTAGLECAEDGSSLRLE
jgi:ribonuclease BN (tRNA processing enzyme)